MDNLTIKLLHERKNSNVRRKIDGKSGKVYTFLWNEQHKAYCYTTESQEEADDLFYSQGRVLGSYFAPVLTMQEKAAPAEEKINDVLVMALMERGLDVPKERDAEAIGLCLVAAYDAGKRAATTVTTVSTRGPDETPATVTANAGATVTFTPDPEPPAPKRKKSDGKPPA